ncbi:MAG: T9SS type A sorting domain-containing protein [Cyclonatronaceae bacterium]
MKSLFFVFASLVFTIFQPLAAQNMDDHPFSDSQVIRMGGDELIGIRAKEDGTEYDLVIEVSRYFTEYVESPNILKILEFKGPQVDRNFNRYSMVTADIDGNGLSEIVASWIIQNKVEVVAMRADPYYLAAGNLGDSIAVWEDTMHVTKPGPDPYSGDGWLRTPPLLTSGDFRGNGTDEFVLAYMADVSGTVRLHLAIFVADDGLTSIREAASSIVQTMVIDQPEALRPSRRPLEMFALTAGDFNGNGKDELLLVGRESSDEGWNIFASMYSFDGENRLDRILHEHIYSMSDISNGALFEIQNMSVLSGPFHHLETEQAVVGFNVFNADNIHVSYMLGLSFDESLTEVIVSEEAFRRARTTTTWDWMEWDNVLQAADINGNGFDEIVSHAGFQSEKTYNIYQLDDRLEFVDYALNLPLGTPDSPVFVVGHVIMDPDGDKDIPEIATGNSLYAPEIGEDGEYLGTGLVASPGLGPYGCWFPNGQYPYNCSNPLRAAELDGDVRLGTPVHSRITDIVQPLVILNAPPTHFDVLDGESYDVSKMYYDNVPAFSATYVKSEETTAEVETEFHKDWGGSATLSGSARYYGATVSGYITGKYGEKFSEVAGSSQSVYERLEITAVGDNRLFATILEYDIWEYPVYGNGVEQGHILVIEPTVTENRWFNSKSPSAYSFVPDHEIGNILSYRQYPDPALNPSADEIIKIGNSHGLGPDTEDYWWLRFEDFEETSATTQKEYGVEFGGSVSAWGVKAEVDGHYSKEEISTHTTRVRKGLELGVNLGAVDMELGKVGYSITPYTYWSGEGALVLDYTVQPELSPNPDVSPTWWQMHYNGKPDPAFILPWRYDPEKGYALSNPEMERHESRDISFFPRDPLPGDVVTITARIRNFSLVATPEGVGVSFYIGDPDHGGTLIEGDCGNTIFYTSPLPARGTGVVEMEWTFPAGIGTRPYIFGLIDAGQAIAEIHENNNKGWRRLGGPLSVGIEDDIPSDLPVSFALQQNYPNPFNPSTTIRFELPMDVKVRLEVFDMLGRRVAVLADGEYGSGHHSVQFNTGNLASGLYLYRLQAPNFTQTRKMMVIK